MLRSDIETALQHWFSESWWPWHIETIMKIHCVDVLRILAMHGAKSVNTQSIKNLRRMFFNNGP